MNKSVPTLLGIIIILLVVVLVILIYDYKLTSGLATGRVAGTVGGELMTGVDQPEEDIGVGEVLGQPEPTQAERSPAQKPGTRASEISAEAAARRSEGRPAESGAPKGSPAEGTELPEEATR